MINGLSFILGIYKHKVLANLLFYYEIIKKKFMTTAYIRVYANKQSVEIQQETITNFAESKNIHIDKWYKDTGNAAKNSPKIEGIIKNMKAGDHLIVADITRLSHKMIEIMHLLLLSIERKITLHSINEGYTFENNVDSKTLAFTFGLVSEMERKLISIRTKEALALTKSKGVVLGRPKGSQQDVRLLPYKDVIEQQIKDGNKTYIELAKRYHVSLNIFKRFVKEHLSPKSENTQE